jgi:hypothetical protein
MITSSNKAKPMNIFFGVLVLIAIVAIAPHAFAQSPTSADDPHGPLQGFAWAVGMGTAGAMSGFGIWTTMRRSKRY